MNQLKFYDSLRDIPFESIGVSQTTSQWVSTFDVKLKQSAIDIFGKRLIYTLGQQDFHFIVDEYSGSESTKGLSTTITGRSLTVLLDAPYSERVLLKTWRKVMFSAIVYELCEAVGLGVHFKITDFYLREYMAVKKAPIEILKELANDAGVSLQTSLNGQILIVCYKYAVNPSLLPSAIGQAITKIFSSSMSLDNKENFDALWVLTTLAAQDSATVEQKTIVNYIRARVFLPNWSDTPPEIRHYGSATIEYCGIKTVLKTADDVEINFGIGKMDAGAVVVDYYYYGDDLGALTVLPDGTVDTAVLQNGLVRIRYQIKCHEFKLTANCCDKIRFEVFESINQRAKIPEIRIRNGSRYAEPVVVQYFDTPVALVARGAQALIDLQDFEVYSLKTDHWDELPLPSDILSFSGKVAYCDGFSVDVSTNAITATLSAKVPIV